MYLLFFVRRGGKVFEVSNNTIYITRGDKGTINLSIDDYIFKVGDVIKFSVYNKKALDKEAVLNKIVNVTKESDNIDIELTSEETKIGEIINKEVEYWYEIELNNNQTILGYDSDGAKILILYPEGVM